MLVVQKSHENYTLFILRLNLKMVTDYWLIVLSPTHEKETAFCNSLQDHHRNKREKNDESKKKANPIATQQTPYPTSIKKNLHNKRNKKMEREYRDGRRCKQSSMNIYDLLVSGFPYQSCISLFFQNPVFVDQKFSNITKEKTKKKKDQRNQTC